MYPVGTCTRHHPTERLTNHRPLARTLREAHVFLLFGPQRADERADAGAAHDVDGNARLLHRPDDAQVRNAPAPITSAYIYVYMGQVYTLHAYGFMR